MINNAHNEISQAEIRGHYSKHLKKICWTKLKTHMVKLVAKLYYLKKRT